MFSTKKGKNFSLIYLHFNIIKGKEGRDSKLSTRPAQSMEIIKEGVYNLKK